MRWTAGGPSRNVDDRRGQGGMFGGGMAPMGIGGTIVLLVLGLIFGKDFTGGSATNYPQTSGGDVGQLQESPDEAHTAAFVKDFLVDDIQDTVWSKLLDGYRPASLIMYRDATPTAC